MAAGTANWLVAAGLVTVGTVVWLVAAGTADWLVAAGTADWLVAAGTALVMAVTGGEETCESVCMRREVEAGGLESCLTMECPHSRRACGNMRTLTAMLGLLVHYLAPTKS